MNAFTIVIVLVAALALLALIFSFIAVRGKNGPWVFSRHCFRWGRECCSPYGLVRPTPAFLAISLRRKEYWAQWLILPSQP